MLTGKIRAQALTALCNAAYDAVLAIDVNGSVRFYNTAAQRLLGDTAVIAGRPVQEVLPGLPLSKILDAGEEKLGHKWVYRGKTLLVYCLPVWDEADRQSGAVIVLRDNEALRHLLDEVSQLHETQLLLEAIINTTQDVISVVDESGRVIMVNPAYTRVIGLTPEEIVGRPPTVDIREGESMHLRVLNTGQPIWNVPMKVGPDGRDVVVNAAPLYVKGVLRGSVAVAHDVSELKKLTEELDHMKSLVRHLHTKYTFDDIVAEGPAMQTAVAQARRAAGTPVTVLLQGESGTGKELFAHAIHHDSPRCYGPFIRVNCAAITESLLESELFGYEEGAFTGARRGGKKGYFEEARGGTLFLDEIGEMPLATQAKLLRVLQEKEIIRVGGNSPVTVDVRIIAATNRDLQQAVRAGQFRQDLYYRISAYPIVIPPLRQRLADLPKLVRLILGKLNQQFGRSVQAVAPEAMTMLMRYNWPGNVRELENVLARALINMRFNDYVVRSEHLLPLPGMAVATARPAAAPHAACPTLAVAVAAAETEAIREALKAADGNKSQAARLLGISPRALYYKLAKYKIS